MTQLDASAITEIKQIIEQRELTHIKVGVFDIDGIMRGKYMSRDKFYSALDKGYGFCNVVLGWDSKDQLYDNVKYTGWHSGYPDAPVRLLPDTYRNMPMEDNGLFVLSEFSAAAESVCPRGCLRRVLEQMQQLGFAAKAGFEYEFFIFEETSHSCRDKHYRDMTPLEPGHFGYSVLRNSTQSDLYTGLLDLSEAMDFRIEGLHEETGPGVMEAAIAVDDALKAADKAGLFKTFCKIYMQRQGLMATFMARWSTDWPGSSGHMHISLSDKNGNPVFHDEQAEYGISNCMRHFLAGQQHFMPELLAMIAPTVNSFRRLVPGFWAPTDASLGVDNRTCALRVVPGGAKSIRSEYRISAADANPYLALAAALASGLEGIRQKLEPTPFVQGNAYAQTFPKKLALPHTLFEAAQRLRKSKMAQEWFGEDFVQHYAATREWEEREFRKAVTDWEMDRYFEII